MHPLISGILLPAATTLFVGLVITPRLEARNRRISAVHQARDEFSRRVLRILSACARLRDTPVPHTLTEERPVLSQRLTAERQRWIDQLDEATRYLVDDLEAFVLSYATPRGRDIAGRFAVYARAVVLSDRPLGTKVERLTALTGPVQDIFFTRRWRLITIVSSFQAFEQAVAAIEEEQPST
ncbi:hypothetical protein ACH4TX_15775 [Streptomyces sp. NPDC021098]|uniref:hypothetical protein n=1 Tax=unclassified Streptomyces TaxID=2593676 RepID=UPI0037926738